MARGLFQIATLADQTRAAVVAKRVHAFVLHADRRTQRRQTFSGALVGAVGHDMLFSPIGPTARLCVAQGREHS